MPTIQYILTDIEGTTTSVSFVYETLFPYFSAHCADYIQKHLHEPNIRTQIEAVKETVWVEDKLQITDNQAIEKLLYWTKTDRKHTALKTLQGYLWRVGYENGEIKGHIYADVPPALAKWQQNAIQMGVYSSGSVEAQKLIFGFSNFGDLTPYFSDYFDTNIGHKREITAYQNIQQQLQIPAQNILFLSDVEAELDAAQSAGFRTIQLLRANTMASEKHPTVKSFLEIDLV
jgi:enolase-phosphatase E1